MSGMGHKGHFLSLPEGTPISLYLCREVILVLVEHGQAWEPMVNCYPVSRSLFTLPWRRLCPVSRLDLPSVPNPGPSPGMLPLKVRG